MASEDFESNLKNLKGTFHNCLSVIDFSEYETLTDSQKEELTDLKTQLKEIMQEDKKTIKQYIAKHFFCCSARRKRTFSTPGF